jgi:DNA-binding response OmpR family regulator
MTFLKKILLLDHQPGLAAALRDALEQTGLYLIKEEHDSRMAMSAARWFQPDLILCDTMMEGLDAGLLRQLQADAMCKDTPVVFVSPDMTGKGAVVSGGILSGYSFLASPVPLEQIGVYLADLLNPPPSAA